MQWRNEDGQLTRYEGVLVEQGIAAEQDWFRVQYADGDMEWMSLKTLETDGTLGSAREKRVQWVLVEHEQDAASHSQVPRFNSSKKCADDESDPAEKCDPAAADNRNPTPTPTPNPLTTNH